MNMDQIEKLRQSIKHDNELIDSLYATGYYDHAEIIQKSVNRLKDELDELLSSEEK